MAVGETTRNGDPSDLGRSEWAAQDTGSRLAFPVSDWIEKSAAQGIGAARPPRPCGRWVIPPSTLYGHSLTDYLVQTPLALAPPPWVSSLVLGVAADFLGR